MSRLRVLGTIALLGLAFVAAFAEPVVAVFCALVALNMILGGGENVPFSTYSMFSNPPRVAWSLRFEDPQGELVPIGKMGINPYITKKRFGTEVHIARERGVDLDDARRHAAEVIASVIEEHRPARGPWSVAPITIVFVEYRLASAGGRRVRTQTALLDTAPA